MKIAIIYSTLISDTKESAKILSELINADVQLISIKNAKDTCLLKYNLIILGASTFNCKVQGLFKIYLSRNIKTLLEKPIALYVNGDENSDMYYNLNKVFTREIIESSLISSNFGYEINEDIGSFKKKIMLKKILKKNEKLPKLNTEEIRNYSNFINELIEKRVG